MAKPRSVSFARFVLVFRRERPRIGPMRYFYLLVFGVLSILGLPVMAAALITVLQADVNHSRHLAFAVIALYFFFLTVTKGLLFNSGNPKLWGTVFLLIAGGFYLAAITQFPPPVPEKESVGFEVKTDDGKAMTVPKWYPTNLLAECDQTHLRTTLTKLLGKEKAPVSAPDVQLGIKEYYDEIRYHARAWTASGSSLHHTYKDWMGLPQTKEHCYYYFPDKQDRVPVILLLHGFEGNLQANLWLFKEVADRQGYALVAPTFGMGNWQSEAGQRRIDKVLEACGKESRFASSPRLLVAFGTAGTGAGVLVSRLPNAFQGMILVRASLDSKALESRASWRNRPTLLLHGAKDTLVPGSQIEQFVKDARTAGVVLKHEEVENADQFFLFSHRQRLKDAIQAWIAALPR